MEREIKISNDLNEISVLASFIEELGEELSLSFETTMNINLALEEAVANIIMYAYPTQEQHTILLRVTYSEKQLVFLLTEMLHFLWRNVQSEVWEYSSYEAL